jgi:hypothetical protein
MAVEARRGCGYRKVGGIYLVCNGAGVVCDRLPFPLHVCPVCNQGIKQSLGWTWVNGELLFGGPHKPSECKEPKNNWCVVCDETEKIRHAGLLWTGKRFYKNIEDFNEEAKKLGISRRISTIPKGFRLGETWVLMAHPKAFFNIKPTPLTVGFLDEDHALFDAKYTPGIFSAFKPSAVEEIITDKQAKDKDFMAELEAHSKKVGVKITPVVVPADDKDHQGTVYDKDEEENDGD